MKIYLKNLVVTLRAKTLPVLEFYAYYYFSDFVMYYKVPIINCMFFKKLVNIFLMKTKVLP